MNTLEIIARSIVTLWVISFTFGLCAFCTPWVWRRKNHFAIIYGPLCVMSVIVALFFVIVGVWS